MKKLFLVILLLGGCAQNPDGYLEQCRQEFECSREYTCLSGRCDLPCIALRDGPHDHEFCQDFLNDDMAFCQETSIFGVGYCRVPCEYSSECPVGLHCDFGMCARREG